MAATGTISGSSKQQRIFSCVSKSITASQTHTHIVFAHSSFCYSFDDDRQECWVRLIFTCGISICITSSNNNNNANNYVKCDCVTFLTHFIRNFLEEFFAHYSERCKSFACHLDHIVFHHVHILRTNAQTLNSVPGTQAQKCIKCITKLDEEMAQWWRLMFHRRRQTNTETHRTATHDEQNGKPNWNECKENRLNVTGESYERAPNGSIKWLNPCMFATNDKTCGNVYASVRLTVDYMFYKLTYHRGCGTDKLRCDWSTEVSRQQIALVGRNRRICLDAHGDALCITSAAMSFIVSNTTAVDRPSIA